jgi:23S rRNA (guanosine2251-2'-O)-methyltransferase
MSASTKVRSRGSLDPPVERSLDPPLRLPVIVVLDNVRSLYNTGAFFRTADGCAVEKLVLCGITPRPDQGARQRHAIAKTALGAETSVAWEYEADTSAAIAKAAAAGYHVVAIENSSDAIDLYQWTPSWPVCLVFGHETDGVAGELARRIETHVRIPMLGQKRSLNVASAAAVVLYELVRRRLSMLSM